MRLAAQQARAISEQIYIKNINFYSRGGIVQCPSCHAKLTPGQKFCTFCGNSVATTASPQGKFCSSCGTSLKADQRFCSEYGTKQ